jgi:hypothetical protein
MSLGFNLVGSLAAIDQWVQDMSSEEEDEKGDERPFTRLSSHVQPRTEAELSPEVPSLKDKILSRDAIFHMVIYSFFLFIDLFSFFHSAQIVLTRHHEILEKMMISLRYLLHSGIARIQTQMLASMFLMSC